MLTPDLSLLTNLIEASDFLKFREVTSLYFRARGHRDAPGVDGWGDGGTDVRFYLLQDLAAPIAVQLTTAKEWKSKLKKDAKQVRSKYEDVLVLNFVSSRRIPEAEFTVVADELLQLHKLAVKKVDTQAIAHTIYTEGKTTELLEIFGIGGNSGDNSYRSWGVRERAAQSCVLFGTTSNNFRNEVVDAVVGTALLSGPLERTDLVERVCAEIKFEQGQESVVESSIDRMLQARQVRSADGEITVTDPHKDTLLEGEQLNIAAWNGLELSLINVLADHGLKDEIAVHLARSLMERAGAIIMANAVGLVDVLTNRSTDMEADLRSRFREALVCVEEFVEQEELHSVMEDVATTLFSSPLAHHMVAGEVFVSMARVSGASLVQALGSSSELTVLLDTSVAMPMLLSKLFRPAGHQAFATAQRLRTQLERHRASISLPYDYLEESATHLLLAVDHYDGLVDSVDELWLSKNVYVAHYVALRKEGYSKGFEAYLGLIGVTHNDLKGEWVERRRKVVRKLQRAFSQSAIETVKLNLTDVHLQNEAETDISFALSELEQTRSDTLLRHDARTVSYLMEKDKTPTSTHVLVTSDSLHLHVYANTDASDWHAMFPGTLTDLLGLARSGEAMDHGLSAWSIAMNLLEEQATIGAAVWDEIARINREDQFDAELLQTARQFRESYLRDDPLRPPEGVAESWKTFTEELVQDDDTPNTATASSGDEPRLPGILDG